MCKRVWLPVLAIVLLAQADSTAQRVSRARIAPLAAANWEAATSRFSELSDAVNRRSMFSRRVCNTGHSVAPGCHSHVTC